MAHGEQGSSSRAAGVLQQGREVPCCAAPVEPDPPDGQRSSPVPAESQRRLELLRHRREQTCRGPARGRGAVADTVEERLSHGHGDVLRLRAQDLLDVRPVPRVVRETEAPDEQAMTGEGQLESPRDPVGVPEEEQVLRQLGVFAARLAPGLRAEAGLGAVIALQEGLGVGHRGGLSRRINDDVPGPLLARAQFRERLHQAGQVPAPLSRRHDERPPLRDEIVAVAGQARGVARAPRRLAGLRHRAGRRRAHGHPEVPSARPLAPH